MKIIQIYLLFFVTNFYGQNQYPIDSSYTVQSVYAKIISRYPYITVPEKSKSKFVTEISNIVYQKESTRALHLDAFIDIIKKRNPAVILIHGGGWKSGNKDQMQIMARQIATKGYSCFAIEYRLSLEAKYPEGIYDVKNAIKFIKENATRFHVNPNKIAILGCSSGGQMAALIGTTNGNSAFENKNIKNNQNANVQAIINVDGTLAFRHPESQEGEMAAFWLGGTYEGNPQNWESAAPLNHVDKYTPPILFINSSIIRFHAGRDDFIAKLNKYKTYNEVHTIENSPHSFWFFEPWLEQTVNYTAQFLDTIFK